MSEPESVATLDVLTKVLTPALFTDANLLSPAHLPDGQSQPGTRQHRCVLLRLRLAWHDRRTAFWQLQGRLSVRPARLDLVERPGLERFKARTYLCFGVFIIPWTRHLRTGRDLLRRAFDAANTAGDLTLAAYSCNNLVGNLLAAGDPLADVQREAEHGLEFARKARFGLVIDVITTQLALIRTLRGLTPTFGCFDDAQFDELSVRAPICRVSRGWQSPRAGTGSASCRRASLPATMRRPLTRH